MWWSANSCAVVGTEGATDARSRPLVSFYGAQGRRAEEHCHTSICHHWSFDCKCVGTFCQLPSSSGQWSVAATIQVQDLGSNRLTESHGQDIADSTQESQ